MKKIALFLTLTAILFVAGCSTPSAPATPSTPKQKPGKYALQFIRIEVPLPDTHTTLSSYAMVSDDIDGLLKSPEAVIIEYPIVYAAVGETTVNDQTTPYRSFQTYEVEADEKGNPKVVYGDEEVVGLGRFVEFTVNGVENGMVSYHVVARDTELAGMQKYDTGVPDENQKKLTASLPVFKKTGIDTEMTQTPGEWIGMGGLTQEKTENFSSGKKSPPKIKRTKKVSFIRIIPPKGVPFKATQPKKNQGTFVPFSELKKTTP
jgi:hypothetical protein